MRKVLGKTFFNNTDTSKIARNLLGTFLVHKRGARTEAYMITEVEAYDGPEDLASHAHRGKTLCNAPMFGEAGNWYIYFVYGMYWMLNIVTGPNNYPAAILIRGVADLNGPGKLTRALHIGKRFNGKRAIRAGGLWIEDRGVVVSPRMIKRTPRIGVSYAGVWAKKPMRFFIKFK